MIQRTSSHAISARDSLRKAAIRLFSEKGYSATSTREICERAKVTKPTLYYHFGSKEQLYRDLIFDESSECKRQLALAATRGETARERLIEVLTVDFALTRREPELTQMMFRSLFSPKKEMPTIDFIEIGMEWADLLEGIIREGVKKRELEGKPREIAEAILGIHLIYTMAYVVIGKPDLNRALARRIIDLVVDGCGNQSGK
jgi:AcrR family transcriptional regulator